MTSTESQTIPIRSWQHEALSELADIVANILANRYESPEDLAGEMKQRAMAIATAAGEPDPIPDMLDAIGSHVAALQFATNEISMMTGEPTDNILARLQYAGWERYQVSTPEDVAVLCSRAINTLNRYRKFSTNTVSHCPEDDLTA